MKTKKYFMISALALLACSCQDEEQGGVQPTPGQEVQFGAALEQNGSRTIYGESDGNAFPIYWQNGDEVIVCSPECAIKSATYKVNVGDETAQNYATSLDKTGEIGVRWGDNPTGNFYSFYPASHAEPSTDYKTMTLTMPAQQDNNIEKNEDGTIKIVRPDMEACFMYASTEEKNGETVNLQYKPLSTAVRFTVDGPTSDSEVTINYVRIYAPKETMIDGSFDIDFEKIDENTGLPTIIANKGRNYVTMNAADPNTNQYLTLKQGEKAELCAFLLLTKNETITSDWYIEIGTSVGLSYKKNLASSGSDSDNTLVSGKVHNLGELPPLNQVGDWDVAHWMSNLQRNVYLSEISIPGSWNSVNTDCQPRNSDVTALAQIQSQYSKGIRAFHLDTRWIANRDNGDDSDIVGLGIADGGETYDINDGKCMRESSATTFADALTTITGEVKSDEYMVLICTFAQGSYNYGAGQWRQAISEACANNDDVFDGRNLTPETVVGQVLGKVIVIVNTYTEGPIPGSKCLFMNMGITLYENDFKNSDYFMVPLQFENSTNTGITVYGTHAQITARDRLFGDGDGYNTDRGYAPSLTEREEKLNAILNWSKENYDDLENYQHNAWMYLGLGGYIDRISSEDYNEVASTLNGWIDGRIQAMPTSGYYPVGIVLMNYVEEGDYPNVVNDILQMNNKYRKAYDPHRSPVDGTDIEGNLGGGNSTVQSAAAGYSSGMTDNNTNAISWTRCR